MIALVTRNPLPRPKLWLRSETEARYKVVCLAGSQLSFVPTQSLGAVIYILAYIKNPVSFSQACGISIEGNIYSTELNWGVLGVL